MAALRADARAMLVLRCDALSILDLHYVSPMPKSKLRIGIDLGGTKIEALAIGCERARNSLGDACRRRQAYEPNARCDRGSRRRRREEGGTQRHHRHRHSGHHRSGDRAREERELGVAERPTARRATSKQRLGRPIRFMNDADCFALSEAIDGAAAGGARRLRRHHRHGCRRRDRRRRQVHSPGANLIAGEWGHNPLPWMAPDEYPGPSCYCGRMGCIEMWVSGPGFEHDHAKRTGREHLRRAEIVQAARRPASRSPRCRSISTAIGSARSLASLVNVLDPDVIVLGGGMSNVARSAAASGRDCAALHPCRRGDVEQARDAIRPREARRLERRSGRGTTLGLCATRSGARRMLYACERDGPLNA